MRFQDQNLASRGVALLQNCTSFHSCQGEQSKLQYASFQQSKQCEAEVKPGATYLSQTSHTTYVLSVAALCDTRSRW